MKIITEIIDLKATFLYSLMIVLFNSDHIKTVYQVVCGAIFLGYNLHRWYIMHKEDKKNTNTRNRNKRR